LLVHTARRSVHVGTAHVVRPAQNPPARGVSCGHPVPGGAGGRAARRRL